MFVWKCACLEHQKTIITITEKLKTRRLCEPTSSLDCKLSSPLKFFVFNSLRFWCPFANLSVVQTLCSFPSHFAEKKKLSGKNWHFIDFDRRRKNKPFTSNLHEQSPSWLGCVCVCAGKKVMFLFWKFTLRDRTEQTGQELQCSSIDRPTERYSWFVFHLDLMSCRVPSTVRIFSDRN